MFLMMKQKVVFKDLGIDQNYQQVWDVQESLLSENLSIKSANLALEKKVFRLFNPPKISCFL